MPQNKEEILEKYKKIIVDEFFPERGYPTLRYSVAKKAISDYKKISEDNKSIAELMMIYVENGVEFTNTYGDIDGQFYNSISGMFVNLLEFISKNNLEETFKHRCRRVMEQSDGIGWGFGDFMVETYYNYFFEDEDEY